MAVGLGLLASCLRRGFGTLAVGAAAVLLCLSLANFRAGKIAVMVSSGPLLRDKSLDALAALAIRTWSCSSTGAGDIRRELVSTGTIRV